MQHRNHCRVEAHRSERGQSLTETALFAILAVLIALGLLAFIPAHRVRTAATAAAYACAQFLSQSPDPGIAMQEAFDVAQKTLDADWNSLEKVRFLVVIDPPAGPGEPGSCTVNYILPAMYSVFGGARQSEVTFVSRSETWKARWQP